MNTRPASPDVRGSVLVEEGADHAHDCLGLIEEE
jgi:hypothetical protein